MSQYEPIRELCARVVKAAPGAEFNIAVLELATAINLRLDVDRQHDKNAPHEEQAD